MFGLGKERRTTIHETTLRSFLVPAIVLFVTFLVTIVFAVLYITLSNNLYLILLLSFDVPLFALYGYFAVTRLKRVHTVYHKGIVDVTGRNLKRLAKGNADLELYPPYKIKEMEEMNETAKALKLRYAHSTYFAPETALESLDLTYLDKGMCLLAEEELKGKLLPLIDASKAFYVGLLSLYYDIEANKLTKDNKNRLLESVNRHFSFIPGRLFAFTGDGELLCFLPSIDSFSIVKEKVLAVSEDCAISAHLASGLSLLPLKSAFVCYPFSNPEDILSDLTYAKHQGGAENAFFSKRYENNVNKATLSSHEGDVAFFHAILTPLIRLSGTNFEAEKATIRKVFEELMHYLGAEEYDIIAWEKSTNRYYAFFEDALSARVYDEGKIKRLNEVADDDNSYYFSSRDALSSSLARDNDPFGRESGFWYVLNDGNDILGVIYLFKKSGTLGLDAYKKEGLLRFGKLMSDYFSLLEKERRARAFQAETEHVLSLGKSGIYRVNDTDFTLTYFSPNLRTVFRNLEVGLPCHKALYGLEKPCARCPMRKFSKMDSKVGNETFVTSLTLNDRKSHERTLFVERSSEPIYETYDANWLVYSFRTLFADLSDFYAVGSRGYVLLLCLDNMEELLKKQGSEGLCFIIRSFVERIKAAFVTHDVFVYNPATIAVLFPRVGHAEIIDCCEKIYNISKENYFDDGTGSDIFSITYLPFGYPRGYATASDFLSHVEEHYRNPALKHGIDYIYFHNQSISCPASRKEYMSAIIDRTFAAEDMTCVTLQPMLTCDKHIFGAEILIRVMDDYRQRPIMADELSRIAVETGKVSIITTFLIHFVEALYAEFGNNVFAVNSFKRVAINTDSSFLGDEGLLDYIKNIASTRSLPPNFLSFEISEDLIRDELEVKSKAFTSAGIALVADRYTGRYVSLPKLKEYGFVKFKIDRGIIRDIETTPVHKNQVLSLIAEAKTLGLKVGAVGVENADQFIILKDADPTIEVQGFHFFKPLSRSDLINALRSHS